MNLGSDNKLEPLKNERKRGGPSQNEQERDLGIYGWMVLRNQRDLSLIRTLKSMHQTMEDKEHPLKQTALEHQESELKAFLKSDHDSPFIKNQKLREYIELAHSSVSFIDETDSSGKRLIDYLPPEDQESVRNQQESLSDTSIIRETLETNLNSRASNLWEDYKQIQAAMAPIRNKEIETLLAGTTPSKKEKEDIQGLIKASQKMGEISEMTCLEKCRIAFNALNAQNKNREEKEKEATLVIGEEFSIIKSQVLHLEKCLSKDWDNAMQTDFHQGIEPSIVNPTTGKALFSPEFLAKVPNPSEDQLASLQDLYTTMALRKTQAFSPEENENERISFLLQTMETLEESKKARYMNQIISLEKSLDLDKNLDDPEEDELENPENQDGRDHQKLNQYKKSRKNIRAGVISAMKGLHSKALAAITAYTVGHIKDLMNTTYGSKGQEDIVQRIHEANSPLNTLT